MHGKARRGFAAVIAMIFLALFSVLALGIYATGTMSSQVTEADRRQLLAQSAAESGLDWVRYQLGRTTIPPGTTATAAIDQLWTDLQAQVAGTANLGTDTISRSGNVIRIPARGYIALDSGGLGRFRVTITDWAGEIVVKSEGQYVSTGSGSTVTRAISLDFTRQMRTGTVFDYAVASKGQIVASKGTISGATGVDPSVATMMSALASGTAINVSGGDIGGELTILDTAGVSVTGGTVAGSSSSVVILRDHVNLVPTAPEFPTWNPLLYRPYATNTWVNKRNTQSNIRIPAGSGTPRNPVTFNANDTVQGILYIESPNNVQFNGNFRLQGFIVMEQGASTTDTLEFKGNVAQSPVPSGTTFDALRATSGVAILAPGAAVSMTGSTDSNVRGSIVCNTFEFRGSAKLTIDQGTLMTLNGGTQTCVFNSAGNARTAGVFFTGSGGDNEPTMGASYSSFYSPKPQTYQEVAP